MEEEVCKRLDKIILLLERLLRNQFYGAALMYPDGERLGEEGSIGLCAEGVELLTRQGVSRRT